MSSCSTCYICLGSDSKKPFVEKTGCHCKGSVSIHASCFKKWVASTSDPLCCSVCKSNYSGSFLRRFMTPEDILFAGGDGSNEDVDDMFYEETFIHGVPVLVDEDGYVFFDNPHHESIFMHSDKMQLKATRQQSMHMSKHQPRRQSAYQRRPVHVFSSRKR